MLEEPNLIPNSDLFDTNILPTALGNDPEILRVQFKAGNELTSDIYPPTKIKFFL